MPPRLPKFVQIRFGSPAIAGRTLLAPPRRWRKLVVSFRQSRAHVVPMSEIFRTLLAEIAEAQTHSNSEITLSGIADRLEGASSRSSDETYLLGMVLGLLKRYGPAIEVLSQIRPHDGASIFKAAQLDLLMFSVALAGEGLEHKADQQPGTRDVSTSEIPPGLLTDIVEGYASSSYEVELSRLAEQITAASSPPAGETYLLGMVLGLLRNFRAAVQVLSRIGPDSDEALFTTAQLMISVFSRYMAEEA